jgi:hypothetical protein
MSNLPRLTRKTAGYLVGQFFDVNDLLGNAYSLSNLPTLYAARYTWVKDSVGIPILQQVANTDGFIGGWLNLPPKAPRTIGQWCQVVPAKITTTSPLKATPVNTGDGSGWSAATDLAEISCFTSDGSAPASGAFGLLVVGTERTAQNPLFFQGGGGSAGDSIFKLTSYIGAGVYGGTAYDYPGGTAGSVVTNLKELNGSPNVPTSGTFYVKASLKGDGNYWFNAPYGC